MRQEAKKQTNEQTIIVTIFKNLGKAWHHHQKFLIRLESEMRFCNNELATPITPTIRATLTEFNCNTDNETVYGT